MKQRYRIEREASVRVQYGRWARRVDYDDLEHARGQWESLNSIAPHRLIDRVTGEVVEPKE